jgi:hypothetical protein
MSKYLIALIAAIGAGGWAYSKIQRRTGGNTQTSLLMAGVAGVIVFLFIIIVFGFLPE